jgi:hypothetical protein
MFPYGEGDSEGRILATKELAGKAAALALPIESQPATGEETIHE